MLALCRAFVLVGMTVAIVMLAACTRSSQRAPSGAKDSVESITTGGVARQYHLHIPPSYQQARPTALVVNLHGYNSNAAQQAQISQMSAKADRAGFIVAYPEGLGSPQSWKFGNRAEGQADVAFIRDLIQQLQDQYSIDSQLIYVTGMSNGAEMSYRLACDLSEIIAAFAPVSGGYPAFDDCPATRPLPVVAFHGTADQLLPYAGKPPLLLPVHDWAAGWAARNGCANTPAVIVQQGDVTGERWSGCHAGADVTLYTIAGKGHSWPGSAMPARITTRDIDATDLIWEFFAAHPKP
jgi:polyhydroxybutyrate depolymerase